MAFIRALSTYLPPKELSNEMLQSSLTGYDVEKISKSVGVKVRHIADSQTTAGDLAVEASKRMFAEYGISPEEIDFVMPFFINANYELPSTGRVAPFGDLKVGYTVGDVSGLYVLPSVGVRMAHISLWCGYNLMQDKKITGVDNKKTLTNYHSIAFGVTLDWGARR